MFKVTTDNDYESSNRNSSRKAAGELRAKNEEIFMEGNWNHVCIVLNKSVVRRSTASVYVNGMCVVSTSKVSCFFSLSPISLCFVIMGQLHFVAMGQSCFVINGKVVFCYNGTIVFCYNGTIAFCYNGASALQFDVSCSSISFVPFSYSRLDSAFFHI